MPKTDHVADGSASRPDMQKGDAPFAELMQEVAHDSMQSIATILTLVAAGKEEVEDRDLVLRRLDQVANQTRALAAMLGEALVVRPSAVTVDASAQASDTVRALTAWYGGTIRFVAGSGAWAAISAASLRRVLTNILMNALRAAGEDGVVQVKVFQNGGRVVIEVEDSGPGFGRMGTLHGIGLRSTRRLVRTAGGRLDVGSSPLGGALVRVGLPATQPSGGVSDEDPPV
jgi:signal transduction histidine kinase